MNRARERSSTFEIVLYYLYSYHLRFSVAEHFLYYRDPLNIQNISEHFAKSSIKLISPFIPCSAPGCLHSVQSHLLIAESCCHNG